MPFIFLLLFLFHTGWAQAGDLLLGTAGAPAAPVDAEKARQDPFIALSPSQRREIVREFKALLSIGAQTASITHWAGRDISDCQNQTSSKEGYCSKCEIQMGDTRASYMFYPSGASCRLEDVDVTVDSCDKTLLKELKPVAKQYAGPMAGQFYIDEDGRSGESNLRFVWKRQRN